MRAASLLLLVAIASCGAPQPVPSDGSPGSTAPPWIADAETSVVILQIAIPGAIAAVQVLPIDATAKQSIVTTLNAVSAGLPGIETALNTYRNAPNATNECRARAAVQLVADTLLSASTSLSSVGFQTPAEMLTALGGLASLVDELLPTCVVVDAGTSSYARHVASVLSSHSRASLRSLPVAR